MESDYWQRPGQKFRYRPAGGGIETGTAVQKRRVIWGRGGSRDPEMDDSITRWSTSSEQSWNSWPDNC